MTATADFDTVKTSLSSPDVLVIDVRSSDEIEKSGQINGTKGLPMNEIKTALSLEGASFLQQYGFSKPGKDAAIITHCITGKRASMSADSFKELGYTNVRVYSGSFADWKAKGGPVMLPGKPFKKQ